MGCYWVLLCAGKRTTCNLRVSLHFRATERIKHSFLKNPQPFTDSLTFSIILSDHEVPEALCVYLQWGDSHADNSEQMEWQLEARGRRRFSPFYILPHTPSSEHNMQKSPRLPVLLSNVTSSLTPSNLSHFPIISSQFFLMILYSLVTNYGFSVRFLCEFISSMSPLLETKP